MIACVGAGFSGAVIARELANAGYSVTVFESRSHVGGHCHTFRDPKTGILMHAHGPHVFHTSNDRVWAYVRQFDEFLPFVNRIKTIVGGRVYSLPINLLTINSFFGKVMSPSEAAGFIDSMCDKSITVPRTFEEQALRSVGRPLYEAFLEGYTQKQWGLPPSALPASVLKRLPLRFNYDDNYYADRYQGLPRHGYTSLIERILDHPRIGVRMGVRFSREMAHSFDHVFYSGPLDAWFGHAEGRLAYRTLDFVTEHHAGDYQGAAVINYGDPQVPWTRITEHKHLAPWETHELTVISKEFSRDCGVDDTPYYPVRLADDHARLAKYEQLVRDEQHVSFVGRLGTYRYLDMHMAIEEALDAAGSFLEAQKVSHA